MFLIDFIVAVVKVSFISYILEYLMYDLTIQLLLINFFNEIDMRN